MQQNSRVMLSLSQLYLPVVLMTMVGWTSPLIVLDALPVSSLRVSPTFNYRGIVVATMPTLWRLCPRVTNTHIKCGVAHVEAQHNWVTNASPCFNTSAQLNTAAQQCCIAALGSQMCARACINCPCSEGTAVLLQTHATE
jgi:hypothetical protein